MSYLVTFSQNRHEPLSYLVFSLLRCKFFHVHALLYLVSFHSPDHTKFSRSLKHHARNHDELEHIKYVLDSQYIYKHIPTTIQITSTPPHHQAHTVSAILSPPEQRPEFISRPPPNQAHTASPTPSPPVQPHYPPPTTKQAHPTSPQSSQPVSPSLLL